MRRPKIKVGQKVTVNGKSGGTATGVVVKTELRSSKYYIGYSSPKEFWDRHDEAVHTVSFERASGDRKRMDTEILVEKLT